MKIYNYHPVTNEYIGDSLADESSLEKGVYLIPANAADKQPSQANMNEVAVFEENNWVIKPDYRGKILYKKNTKEEVRINNIGVVPDEDLTEIPPKEFDIWDYSLNQWVVDVELKKDLLIRPLRNDLLNEVDLKYCNAEKWELMTLEQKQVWRNYKQLLRDFPSICDVDNPVFPIRPE